MPEHAELMQKMKDLTIQFRDGKVSSVVTKLIIPAVIAQLISFVYNVVDRLYVSNIEGIQTQALAAIGVVFPITIIVQSFANLIGLGGSPKASFKLGEGDPEAANRYFNNAFISLTVTGVALTFVLYFLAEPIVVLFGCPSDAVVYATEYLEIYSFGTVFIILVLGLNPFISAQGHAVTAMLTVLLGAVLNIALDYVFIFVAGMGVKGASLATVISQCCSFIWVLGFFLNKGSLFKFRLKQMILDKKVMGGILFLGLSPFVMTFTESMIQIVFNVCLKSSTGGEDSVYTATLAIMLSALQLISLPLNGLGYGVAPFVSYNYGTGNGARVTAAIKFVFATGVVFAVAVYCVSMIFPQIYAFVFNAEKDVQVLIKSYLPMFLAGTIMFPVQMTLQNINVALGQGRTAVILAVMRKVVILIPLCFLLSHTLGYKGVYMSEGIADAVAGIITGIVIFTTFPKVIKKRAAETGASKSASKS